MKHRPCQYRPGDRLRLRYTCPPPLGGAPACHDHDDPVEGVTGTVVSVHWDTWTQDYRMHVEVDGRLWEDGSQVISTHYRECHVIDDDAPPLDLLALLAVTA